MIPEQQPSQRTGGPQFLTNPNEPVSDKVTLERSPNLIPSESYPDSGSTCWKHRIEDLIKNSDRPGERYASSSMTTLKLAMDYAPRRKGMPIQPELRTKYYAA